MVQSKEVMERNIHAYDEEVKRQLAEQSRKMTAKVDGQQKQISRLTDKVMEQSDAIDRLQERASDGIDRI